MPSCPAPASLALARKSKTPRKAASVLPLPVGEETRVEWPSRISGTAKSCAGAKWPNRPRTHRASAGCSAAASCASESRGAATLGSIGKGPAGRQAPAGFQGVDVRHRLVGPDAVYPREAQGEAALVPVARVDGVEGD